MIYPALKPAGILMHNQFSRKKHSLNDLPKQNKKILKHTEQVKEVTALVIYRKFSYFESNCLYG